MNRINELTTKDVSYLKDELSWLLVAAKKSRKYEQEVQDPGLRQLFHRIGQQHQAQYDRLHRHLQHQSYQSPATQQQYASVRREVGQSQWQQPYQQTAGSEQPYQHQYPPGSQRYDVRRS